MKIEVMRKNNTEIAVVSSDELLITDVQSALDLVMTVKYETGCTNIALNKEAVVNDFFVLSTCLNHRNSRRDFAEIYQLWCEICHIR